MINEEIINSEDTGIIEEHCETEYIPDAEDGMSYVLSVLFLFISLALSVLIILYPEMAAITVQFLKKASEANISGIVSEYAEGLRNVFI